MANDVTHHANTRQAIAVAVLAEIDAGAGTATLELQLVAGTEVATLDFPDPAAPAPLVGVITFDCTPPIEDASATGHATDDVTKFAIISPVPTDCVYGTVGTSGADINLSSVQIQPTDAVSISALTYTAPL